MSRLLLMAPSRPADTVGGLNLGLTIDAMLRALSLSSRGGVENSARVVYLGCGVRRQPQLRLGVTEVCLSAVRWTRYALGCYLGYCCSCCCCCYLGLLGRCGVPSYCSLLFGVVSSSVDFLAWGVAEHMDISKMQIKGVKASVLGGQK